MPRVRYQRNHSALPHLMRTAIFGTLLTYHLLHSVALAQEASLSYPSSPLITPSVLAPEAKRDLETLLREPLAKSDLLKLTQRLCPQAIQRSPARDASVESSILDAKMTLAIELLFHRAADVSASFIDSFSLIVEFSPTRVLMRHMRPRFPSDLPGYSAPLSSEATRPVRIEGEMGADLFMLIPPVRECGVQALAICPRRFEKIARLLAAPYELKKMRLLLNAKADAVLAASGDTSRKVMVSVLGSQGTSLPSEWFKSVSGPQTLSVTQSVSHDLKSTDPQPSFEVIDTLPARASVESRVDVGTDAHVLHSTRKRTSIEVSTIELPKMPNLLVGRSPLSVEGGQCYLLAQWSEESV